MKFDTDYCHDSDQATKAYSCHTNKNQDRKLFIPFSGVRNALVKGIIVN